MLNQRPDRLFGEAPILELFDWIGSGCAQLQQPRRHRGRSRRIALDAGNTGIVEIPEGDTVGGHMSHPPIGAALRSLQPLVLVRLTNVTHGRQQNAPGLRARPSAAVAVSFVSTVAENGAAW